MRAALLVTGSYAGAEMAGGQDHPGAKASEPVDCTCPCEARSETSPCSRRRTCHGGGARGQVALQSGKVFGADDRDRPDVALAQEVTVLNAAPHLLHRLGPMWTGQKRPMPSGSSPIDLVSPATMCRRSASTIGWPSEDELLQILGAEA